MRTAEDFDIEPWRAYAACAEHDTDLFFPTTGEDVRMTAAAPCAEPSTFALKQP